MNTKERTMPRIAIYLVGLALYAFAVCLMTRAAVGISPITSFPYLIAHMSQWSLGTTQFIVNALIVLAQVILLRGDFEKRQVLQLVASLGFSVFIDLLMPTTAMFDATSASLGVKLATFALSMLIMSTGLGTMTICHLILLPGDGLAQAIARKLNWPFGKAKVLNDSIFVSLTLIVSLICLNTVVGIQWGTVVAALVLGNLVRLVIRVGTPFYMKIVVTNEPQSL